MKIIMLRIVFALYICFFSYNGICGMERECGITDGHSEAEGFALEIQESVVDVVGGDEEEELDSADDADNGVNLMRVSHSIRSCLTRVTRRIVGYQELVVRRADALFGSMATELRRLCPYQEPEVQGMGYVMFCEDSNGVLYFLIPVIVDDHEQMLYVRMIRSH